MNENKKPKGTWLQRFFITILAFIFGVLLFWLLGFFTKDIGSIRGPDFTQTRARFVDAALDEQAESLNETLDELRINIKNKREQQEILQRSTNNLQNTINQLLSSEQKQIVSQSQTMYIENQTQYQELNKEIFDLTDRQRKLEKELSSVKGEIDTQLKLAQDEYNKLQNKHRLKVAALKLAVVIPLFLISTFFFIKKRTGIFSPIVYTVFIAAFIRISLIVHEYFPRRYFKYIALIVITGIILKLLISLIKAVISPKESRILKQHQEAYDKNNCPNCNKPIRTGPLRYASGRKQASFILAEQNGQTPKLEIYTCPSCGTQLYEKCDKCNDIRHSLLPFCEHCGNTKENWI